MDEGSGACLLEALFEIWVAAAWAEAVGSWVSVHVRSPHTSWSFKMGKSRKELEGLFKEKPVRRTNISDKDSKSEKEGS